MRFGLAHLPCTSRSEFAAAARRVEELGFDFLAAPDHLGVAAPFAALVAAGMVTRRIRLRTYVLNACFWNPALLAREAATADLLTDGRLELGLGAGHMKAEFDDAGIRWPALAERIERLETTVREIRRRLADGVAPQPVQQPPPLAIGAMSRRGLAVAAEHADIVSFAGLRHPRRRRLAFECIDATEHAPHLAGALGGALATELIERGWVKRDEGRNVRLTPAGDRGLRALGLTASRYR
jgi:probable F420-dependent oxidoreductase